MANGRDEDQLDVVEKGGYSGTKNSMSRDTQAFDRLTPLGGESYREMLGRTAEAPEPTRVDRGKTATPPGMLSRDSLKRAENASPSYRAADGGMWVVSDYRVGRGWWFVAVTLLLVCGATALYLVMGPTSGVVSEVAVEGSDDSPDEDVPEDIQGVEVRRGLQGTAGDGDDNNEAGAPTDVPSGDLSQD